MHHNSCLTCNFNRGRKRIVTLICLLFLITSSMYGYEYEDFAPENSNTEAMEMLVEQRREERKQDSIKNEEDIETLKFELNNCNNDINKLRDSVFGIDTLKIPKQQVKKLVFNYRQDLGNIVNNFNSAASTDIIDKELITLKKYFNKQQAEINKQFNELQEWIDKPEPPVNPGPDWLLISGIAFGVALLVFSTIIRPMLMSKSADKKQKKAEWQALNLQYQQLPQDLDAPHLPIIQMLLSQYTSFIEKPPKKLHKNEALEKIKQLKIKELKIKPKIHIPGKN